MKIWYRWAVDINAKNFTADIDKCISMIEEMDLLFDNVANHMTTIETKNGESKPYYIKTTKDNGVVYDLFCGNLQIHVAKGKEVIYSIRLKKYNESWIFENEDYSHPKNSTYEVFPSYSIPVLNVTRAVGERYEHGSWDEYVYKTMKKIVKTIDNSQESSIFNMDYENKKEI